jgi:hypothetical protein
MTAGADEILARLVAEESPLRAAGIDLFTDFLLGRRVAELVDVEASVEILLAALTEDNVTRVVVEHLSPAWDRHRQRSEARAEKLGDGFPEDAREKLEELLARQKPPKMAWAKGAVDPILVQKLLAPVLQRTLLSFARKLPLVGAGAGGAAGEEGKGLGGLAGKLGKEAAKRAQKIAGTVGKSVIGGIGAEMNERIQSAARDFSKEAEKELREALVDRLKSDEGRELAREIRRQALDRVFGTEVAVLMRDVEELPRKELEGLVGPVLAYDARREIGRAAVDEELRAFLDVEGAKTVGELAEELGIAEAVRATVRGRLDALARELFAAPGFRRWLEKLVAG